MVFFDLRAGLLLLTLSYPLTVAHAATFFGGDDSTYENPKLKEEGRPTAIALATGQSWAQQIERVEASNEWKEVVPEEYLLGYEKPLLEQVKDAVSECTTM